MTRGFWKNLLCFVLVLVLTVFTVSFLSMATAAKTETAPERYARQVQAARENSGAELSAQLSEKELSPWVSLGAFAVVLAVPAAGFGLYRRSRRQTGEKRGGAQVSRRSRSHSGRAFGLY